jgi:NTP pyrophosphatase (non-canonical NTP hydrolase)
VKEDVEAWMIRNFPNESRVSVTLGLCEEVGEVARAVLKQEQGIRGTWEEWDNEIKKELGDVYLKLMQVAMVCGFDLDEAIAQRWEVIRQRDWVRNPKGHGI